jgi:hypothetical protein
VCGPLPEVPSTGAAVWRRINPSSLQRESESARTHPARPTATSVGLLAVVCLSAMLGPSPTDVPYGAEVVDSRPSAARLWSYRSPGADLVAGRFERLGARREVPTSGVPRGLAAAAVLRRPQPREVVVGTELGDRVGQGPACRCASQAVRRPVLPPIGSPARRPARPRWLLAGRW